METKRTRINESKNLKKNDTINKPIVKLTREKAHTDKIRNEKGDVRTQLTKTQSLIRDFVENLYSKEKKKKKKANKQKTWKISTCMTC